MPQSAADAEAMAHVPIDGDGGWRSVAASEVPDGTPLLLMNVLPEGGVDNMTQLTHLHEPAIVHNLQHRLAKQKVYTDVGQICLAVNPFCWETSAPLYTPAVAARYRQTDTDGGDGALPPHLFALAERTHRALRTLGGDQTVLVSGESGAGKTESVKLLMSYLSSAHDDVVAGGGGGGGGGGGTDVSAAAAAGSVAARVLATNPLLEAFGNASTLRNANSSRFGKFIRLHFSAGGLAILGASIDVYLLEKSRVAQRIQGERSYHIFYQMLHGASATELDEPCGHAYPGTFRYLDGGGGGAPPVDVSAGGAAPPAQPAAADGGTGDAAGLARTRAAMAAVGMDAEEMVAVWRTLSAVLLLGQVEIVPAGAAAGGGTSDGVEADGGEAAEVGDGGGGKAAQARVAELLGVGASDLSRALCTRRLVTREEEVTVRLTPTQAADSRDALSKALYGRLFGWLVAKCNETIAVASPGDGGAADAAGPAAALGGTVGILDIFGFESFAVNSFEQLCINYANEALQQHFCADVFRSEQAEYVAEGVPWEAIPYDDNAEVLAVLGRRERMGVLPLLDEESAIQSGTDLTFVQKLRAAHPAGPHLTFPKAAASATFTVRHYAGSVTYTATTMREKNRDTLHPDLAALMTHGARAPFVQALFAPPAEGSAGGRSSNGSNGSGSGGGRRAGHSASADRMSVGAAFVSQLGALMRTIGATQTHYCRCVKPSASGARLRFDPAYVAHQLRSAGVLEAVRIARLAYPTRMPHGALLKRFHLLAPSAAAAGGGKYGLTSDAAKQFLMLPSNADVDERTACARLLEQLLPPLASDDGEPAAAAAAVMATASRRRRAHRFVVGATKAFLRAARSRSSRRSAAGCSAVTPSRCAAAARRRLPRAVRRARFAAVAVQRARGAPPRGRATWRAAGGRCCSRPRGAASSRALGAACPRRARGRRRRGGAPPRPASASARRRRPRAAPPPRRRRAPPRRRRAARAAARRGRHVPAQGAARSARGGERRVGGAARAAAGQVRVGARALAPRPRRRARRARGVGARARARGGRRGGEPALATPRERNAQKGPRGDAGAAAGGDGRARARGDPRRRAAAVGAPGRVTASSAAQGGAAAPAAVAALVAAVGRGAAAAAAGALGARRLVVGRPRRRGGGGGTPQQQQRSSHELLKLLHASEREREQLRRQRDLHADEARRMSSAALMLRHETAGLRMQLRSGGAAAAAGLVYGGPALPRAATGDLTSRSASGGGGRPLAERRTSRRMLPRAAPPPHVSPPCPGSRPRRAAPAPLPPPPPSPLPRPRRRPRARTSTAGCARGSPRR